MESDGRMRRLIVFTVISLSLVADHRARAQTCPPGDRDAADGERVVAALQRERRRVWWWSAAWSGIYGGATAAQLGIAFTTDDDDRRIDYAIGGAKSALALIAGFALPIRVRAPRPPGDACEDRALALAALSRSARSERRGKSWIAFTGALLVNAAGVVVAGSLHGDWLRATAAGGIGFGVGVLKIVTQPYGAARLDARLAPSSLRISVAPLVIPDGAVVALSGDF
jgi:hypothetical protein